MAGTYPAAARIARVARDCGLTVCPKRRCGPGIARNTRSLAVLALLLAGCAGAPPPQTTAAYDQAFEAAIERYHLPGLAVGVISGMFGIGGGFLMTPLLIFIGIAPAVAVASVTCHIAASSFSGAINYWRRRAIDLPLAFVLLAGGAIGTARTLLDSSVSACCCQPSATNSR